MIEGAARHLVADRLAITGSRWSVPGAEALLQLRISLQESYTQLELALRLRRSARRIAEPWDGGPQPGPDRGVGERRQRARRPGDPQRVFGLEGVVEGVRHHGDPAGDLDDRVDARHRTRRPVVDRDELPAERRRPRATTVGFAPATARSPAYLALPVTMSRASIRVVGRPITRCWAAGSGLLDTAGRRIWAALAVREPKVAERPSGATTLVSRVRRERGGRRHRLAAAVTSLARAAAAGSRAGPYSELTEFEPPVN